MASNEVVKVRIFLLQTTVDHTFCKGLRRPNFSSYIHDFPPLAHANKLHKLFQFVFRGLLFQLFA